MIPLSLAARYYAWTIRWLPRCFIVHYDYQRMGLGIQKRFLDTLYTADYVDVLAKAGSLDRAHQYTLLIFLNFKLFIFGVASRSYTNMSMMGSSTMKYADKDVLISLNRPLWTIIPLIKKFKWKVFLPGYVRLLDGWKNKPNIGEQNEGACSLASQGSYWWTVYSPYMEAGVGIEISLSSCVLDYVWRLTYGSRASDKRVYPFYIKAILQESRSVISVCAELKTYNCSQRSFVWKPLFYVGYGWPISRIGCSVLFTSFNHSPWPRKDMQL